MEITSTDLLADLIAYVRAASCACEPLFDDQPDGARFGPPCERCKLIERADELTDNAAGQGAAKPYPEPAGSDILSTAICEVCGKHSTWGGLQSGRRMTECECCNGMTWHSFSPNAEHQARVLPSPECSGSALNGGGQ